MNEINDRSTSPDSHPHEPIRILVVDDEPLISRLVCRWLREEGYYCQTADCAEDGLRALENGAFSLVLSDIRMPGMSGVDLLSQVKTRWPDVAVVMATAVDHRETAIRSLQLGAYGYVTKPLDQNEVIINVVNALERRRLVLEGKQYEQRLERTVRDQTREIRHSREEIALRLIAAQEYRHDESGAHVRRIGMYAEALGKALAYPEEHVELLRLAAPMHDVGKIGIPDAILLKPAKLTPEEFDVIKTHTTIGSEILSGSDLPLIDLSRQIALCHHEKWDGSGYPQGLAGAAIPEAARLVAIIDVYDALSHDRVYRPAMTEDQTLSIIMQGKGKHFNPVMLDAFLRALPKIREIREAVRDAAPGA